METYISLLQSYTGRDKIIRTTAYTCVLLTGAVKGKLAQDLGVIAKNISAARTVLRLFDDIPVWYYTKSWGAGETDLVSRICSILGNVSIQFYYPFEKIAWAADEKILPIGSKRWWDLGIASWALYLIFYIIKGVRQIALIRAKRVHLIKQRKLESPEKRGAKDEEFRQKISELAESEIDQYWTLLKNLGDLVMAINWLPFKGVLWCGKLSPARNAFFGALSSWIGLYLMVKETNRKLKAAKEKSA